MKKKLLFGAFAALALGAGIATAVGTAQSARAQSSKLSFGNVETLDETETCTLWCTAPDNTKYSVACYTTPCNVEDGRLYCGQNSIGCGI